MASLTSSFAPFGRSGRGCDPRMSKIGTNGRTDEQTDEWNGVGLWQSVCSVQRCENADSFSFYVKMITSQIQGTLTIWTQIRPIDVPWVILVDFETFEAFSLLNMKRVIDLLAPKNQNRMGNLTKCLVNVQQSHS